jgi:uncharacterized protein (TIGR03067 family)
MIAGEQMGMQRNVDKKEGQRWVIKGDRILAEFNNDGKIHPGTFTIDASREPPAIDLVEQDGPEDVKGKVQRGVYELDGDTLRVCVNPRAVTERPKELRTAAGEETMILIFKREPAEKEK